MARKTTLANTSTGVPVRVVYRDAMEQDGHETWHGCNVSFPSLPAALQAIEAEGANITVDYVMLMTVDGEVLLRQEDVKRLISIGKRGGRH